MNDWWSKKLAGEKPTTSRTSPYPATTYPTPMAPPQSTQVRQPQPQQVDTAPASSFTEALKKGITNGGEAARREVHNCPACGSAYVFSRAKGSMLNGASPAPRCYECGWNGLYEQAEQSNWS